MSSISATELLSPSLPSAGPISALLAGLLTSPDGDRTAAKAEPGSVIRRLAERVEDPLRDDDLQLALYLSYELHYRSFRGVADDWEWSPGLLAARAELERLFLSALKAEIGPGEWVDPGQVGDALSGSRRQTTVPRCPAT